MYYIPYSQTSISWQSSTQTQKHKGHSVHMKKILENAIVDKQQQDLLNTVLTWSGPRTQTEEKLYYLLYTSFVVKCYKMGEENERNYYIDRNSEKKIDRAENVVML